MFDFLDQYPYLLPVIIFFGRIIDVTLGTLRIIFVSKGEKYKAPIIGLIGCMAKNYLDSHNFADILEGKRPAGLHKLCRRLCYGQLRGYYH